MENKRKEVVGHTGPRLRGRVVKTGSQIGWAPGLPSRRGPGLCLTVIGESPSSL